jgi:hypothetical protein
MGVSQLTLEYLVDRERYDQTVQMAPSLLSQLQDLVARNLGGRRIQVKFLVKNTGLSK